MSPYRFLDAAHAEFYALGKRELAGEPVSTAVAQTVRSRLLPFMDLSDARGPSLHLAPMGGRERRELRKGVVALPRFVAWATEYAAAVDDCGEPYSVYDPDLLLEALMA
jgi:hypothetical protein